MTCTPCAQYIVSGDNSGMIEITSFASSTPQSCKCVRRFATGDSCVYDVVFLYDNLLVVCGDGGVSAWLASSGATEYAVLWRWRPEKQISSNDIGLPRPEVNALAIQDDGIVYAVCGSGRIYKFRVHAPGASDAAYTVNAVVTTPMALSVYCIAIQGTTMVSGGEDGCVRVWDTTTDTCTMALDVAKGVAYDANIAKRHNTTENRHYITSVALSECIWLCASCGDRYVSLWHLPSRSNINIMPTMGIPRKVLFNRGNVVCVGSERGFYRWSLTGRLIRRMKLPSNSMQSMVVHPPSHCIIVTGDNATMHILLNMDLVAFSLNKYERNGDGSGDVGDVGDVEMVDLDG